MPREYYTETQKLQKLWLWVIAFDPLFVGTILAIVFNKTSTSFEAMLPALLIMLIASSFVVWIFTASKLITVIDEEGIKYRYPVFKPKWKRINKEEIKAYDLKTYDALFDYGGWGIKKSKKNGRSVTIQGDIGLDVILKNGEHILIGLHDKENTMWAMKKMMQTNSENN